MNVRITDDDFVDQYLAVFSKEFGEALTAPRLSMFSLLLFIDQRLTLEVDSALRKSLHVNSVSSLRGLLDEPEVDPWYAQGQGTGLFVVPPGALGELVKKKLLTVAEQKALIEAKGGAMLGKARGHGEWQYVVVAADQASLEWLLDQLAKAAAPLGGLTRLNAQ